MNRRRLVIALALALVTPIGACRSKASRPPEHPRSQVSTPVQSGTSHPGTPQPRSELSPEADRLRTALARGDVASIRAWMTPELRARVGLAELRGASARLLGTYGPPMGILEEHTQREGNLRWYSGLTVHGRGGELRPILYQLALDGEARLARLLVREHVFSHEIEAPADHYASITRIHFPAHGEWSVLHGGRRRATNYHHKSIGQRFAFDLVVRRLGRQAPRGARRNEQYYCWGRDVLAPAAGTVVLALDGIVENVPGVRGRAGGNGVVIDHGFGEFSSLWHFVPGSVRVRVGDRVEVGQPLGRVGNSGRSTAPHIHFHVSKRLPNGREIGLPVEFVDLYVDGRWHDRYMPVRGQTVQRLSPRAMAVGERVVIDL